MNYQKHYNNLIERARYRLIEGYVEKHHVIPRCMGGIDGEVVALTPEEHYGAHQLLVKIYSNEQKLIYAAKMMTVKAPDHKRRNNKLYGWLKRKWSKEFSHTDDFKKRASDRMKEDNPNYKLSEEQIKKKVEKQRQTMQKIGYSKPWLGTKQTKDQKQKQSERQKGKIWITDGKNCLMIQPNQLNSYTEKDWKRGRIIKKRNNKEGWIPWNKGLTKDKDAQGRVKWVK